MIDTFLFKSHLISFEACMTNMFFVVEFIAMQSLTLIVLSYDRYVAICSPLRYTEIVTNKSILVITVILWLIVGTANLFSAGFMSRLSYCKSTVIHSYFCDHGPMPHLACNDNTPSVVMNWVLPVMVLWFPVLFITGTYMCIGRALLKIAASERLKAMKTCTSHLLLVSVFYLPILITEAMGSAIDKNTKIINMSLSTLMPPLLNPFIYSLKTAEFKESIKKLYRRKIHITV
ncbi:olfactory receptor 6B3-like [Conger conger]|uniref:olfactory receptor 6B3-like n=1 Tax=Conger conger TaxID=82655 RepID=UPI002A59D3C8|nr:olfactory receptor 6B3-like [Conger conger]